MLLGELGLHARDGCLEEEKDKMHSRAKLAYPQPFICAFSTDLLEGRDIGRAIFEFDNDKGMTGSKQDEI